MPILFSRDAHPNCWFLCYGSYVLQQLEAQEQISVNLTHILAYVLGPRKNRFIETVLLSTYNTCFA